MLVLMITSYCNPHIFTASFGGKAESQASEERSGRCKSCRSSCNGQPRRGSSTGERGGLQPHVVPEGVRPPHQHHDACLQGGLLGGEAEGRLGEGDSRPLLIEFRSVILLVKQYRPEVSHALILKLCPDFFMLLLLL